jgi:hypothetical protein
MTLNYTRSTGFHMFALGIYVSIIFSVTIIHNLTSRTTNPRALALPTSPSKSPIAAQFSFSFFFFGEQSYPPAPLEMDALPSARVWRGFETCGTLDASLFGVGEDSDSTYSGATRTGGDDLNWFSTFLCRRR